MKRIISYISILLYCFPVLVASQAFSLPKGQKMEKVKFQLINNLVVVPIEVNGTELFFLLDSGVDKPILFNLADRDSLQVNNVSEITLGGLGDGEPLKALKSTGNTFKIKGIQNKSQQLFIVFDKDVNFSAILGRPIHGIIGYDLFRDFVVDIDYSRKIVKFHDPNFYIYKNSKRQQTLPLSIVENKAYIEGSVFLKDTEKIPVRLLVDTGSSDAIWLFENEVISPPNEYYEDLLGKGLNGNIFGKRAKIGSITIGGFAINDAKAAFPDKEAFGSIQKFVSRNGSIGGGVLKRFNIIFDYPMKKITLRKNGYFKEPFNYNLSGLNLQHNGMRYIAERILHAQNTQFWDDRKLGDVQLMLESQTRLSVVPEIVVSGIRSGSPAHEAGLQEGDVILAINGKKVHRYELQEVLGMLNEKEGKRIKLLVERYSSNLVFSFVLQNMFKKE